MSQTHKTNTAGKKVAVVIGATSKWQSDGRNTLLAHGKTVDDSICRSACAGAWAAPLRRSSRRRVSSSC